MFGFFSTKGKPFAEPPSSNLDNNDESVTKRRSSRTNSNFQVPNFSSYESSILSPGIMDGSDLDLNDPELLVRIMISYDLSNYLSIPFNFNSLFSP